METPGSTHENHVAKPEDSDVCHDGCTRQNPSRFQTGQAYNISDPARDELQNGQGARKIQAKPMEILTVDTKGLDASFHNDLRELPVILRRVSCSSDESSDYSDQTESCFRNCLDFPEYSVILQRPGETKEENCNKNLSEMSETDAASFRLASDHSVTMAKHFLHLPYLNEESAGDSQVRANTRHKCSDKTTEFTSENTTDIFVNSATITEYDAEDSVSPAGIRNLTRNTEVFAMLTLRNHELQNGSISDSANFWGGGEKCAQVYTREQLCRPSATSTLILSPPPHVRAAATPLLAGTLQKKEQFALATNFTEFAKLEPGAVCKIPQRETPKNFPASPLSIPDAPPDDDDDDGDADSSEISASHEFSFAIQDLNLEKSLASSRAGSFQKPEDGVFTTRKLCAIETLAQPFERVLQPSEVKDRFDTAHQNQRPIHETDLSAKSDHCSLTIDQSVDTDPLSHSGSFVDSAPTGKLESRHFRFSDEVKSIDDNNHEAKCFEELIDTAMTESFHFNEPILASNQMKILVSPQTTRKTVTVNENSHLLSASQCKTKEITTSEEVAAEDKKRSPSVIHDDDDEEEEEEEEKHSSRPARQKLQLKERRRFMCPISDQDARCSNRSPDSLLPGVVDKRRRRTAATTCPGRERNTPEAPVLAACSGKEDLQGTSFSRALTFISGLSENTKVAGEEEKRRGLQGGGCVVSSRKQAIHRAVVIEDIEYRSCDCILSSNARHWKQARRTGGAYQASRDNNATGEGEGVLCAATFLTGFCEDAVTSSVGLHCKHGNSSSSESQAFGCLSTTEHSQTDSHSGNDSITTKAHNICGQNLVVAPPEPVNRETACKENAQRTTGHSGIDHSCQCSIENQSQLSAQCGISASLEFVNKPCFSETHVEAIGGQSTNPGPDLSPPTESERKRAISDITCSTSQEHSNPNPAAPDLCSGPVKSNTSSALPQDIHRSRKESNTSPKTNGARRSFDKQRKNDSDYQPPQNREANTDNSLTISSCSNQGHSVNSNNNHSNDISVIGDAPTRYRSKSPHKNSRKYSIGKLTVKRRDSIVLKEFGKRIAKVKESYEKEAPIIPKIKKNERAPLSSREKTPDAPKGSNSTPAPGHITTTSAALISGQHRFIHKNSRIRPVSGKGEIFSSFKNSKIRDFEAKDTQSVCDDHEVLTSNRYYIGRRRSVLGLSVTPERGGSSPNRSLIVRQTRASILRQFGAHSRNSEGTANSEESRNSDDADRKIRPNSTPPISLKLIRESKDGWKERLSCRDETMAEGLSIMKPKALAKRQTTEKTTSSKSSLDEGGAKCSLREPVTISEMDVQILHKAGVVEIVHKNDCDGGSPVNKPVQRMGFLRQTQSHLSRIKASSANTNRKLVSSDGLDDYRKTKDGADTEFKIASKKMSDKGVKRSHASGVSTPSGEVKTSHREPPSQDKSQAMSPILRKASRKENICRDPPASVRSPRTKRNLRILGVASSPEVVSPLTSPSHSDMAPVVPNKDAASNQLDYSSPPPDQPPSKSHLLISARSSPAPEKSSPAMIRKKRESSQSPSPVLSGRRSAARESGKRPKAAFKASTADAKPMSPSQSPITPSSASTPSPPSSSHPSSTSPKVAGSKTSTSSSSSPPVSSLSSCFKSRELHRLSHNRSPSFLPVAKRQIGQAGAGSKNTSSTGQPSEKLATSKRRELANEGSAKAQRHGLTLAQRETNAGQTGLDNPADLEVDLSNEAAKMLVDARKGAQSPLPKQEATSPPIDGADHVTSGQEARPTIPSHSPSRCENQKNISDRAPKGEVKKIRCVDSSQGDIDCSLTSPQKDYDIFARRPGYYNGETACSTPEPDSEVTGSDSGTPRDLSDLTSAKGHSGKVTKRPQKTSKEKENMRVKSRSPHLFGKCQEGKPMHSESSTRMTEKTSGLRQRLQKGTPAAKCQAAGQMCKVVVEAGAQVKEKHTGKLSPEGAAATHNTSSRSASLQKLPNKITVSRLSENNGKLHAKHGVAVARRQIIPIRKMGSPSSVSDVTSLTSTRESSVDSRFEDDMTSVTSDMSSLTSSSLSSSVSRQRRSRDTRQGHSQKFSVTNRSTDTLTITAKLKQSKCASTVSSTDTGQMANAKRPVRADLVKVAQDKGIAVKSSRGGSKLETSSSSGKARLPLKVHGVREITLKENISQEETSYLQGAQTATQQQVDAGDHKKKKKKKKQVRTGVLDVTETGAIMSSDQDTKSAFIDGGNVCEKQNGQKEDERGREKRALGRSVHSERSSLQEDEAIVPSSATTSSSSSCAGEGSNEGRVASSLSCLDVSPAGRVSTPQPTFPPSSAAAALTSWQEEKGSGKCGLVRTDGFSLPVQLEAARGSPQTLPPRQWDGKKDRQRSDTRLSHFISGQDVSLEAGAAGQFSKTADVSVKECAVRTVDDHVKNGQACENSPRIAESEIRAGKLQHVAGREEEEACAGTFTREECNLHRSPLLSLAVDTMKLSPASARSAGRSLPNSPGPRPTSGSVIGPTSSARLGEGTISPASRGGARLDDQIRARGADGNYSRELSGVCEETAIGFRDLQTTRCQGNHARRPDAESNDSISPLTKSRQDSSHHFPSNLLLGLHASTQVCVGCTQAETLDNIPFVDEDYQSDQLLQTGPHHSVQYIPGTATQYSSKQQANCNKSDQVISEVSRDKPPSVVKAFSDLRPDTSPLRVSPILYKHSTCSSFEVRVGAKEEKAEEDADSTNGIAHENTSDFSLNQSAYKTAFGNALLFEEEGRYEDEFDVSTADFDVDTDAVMDNSQENGENSDDASSVTSESSFQSATSDILMAAVSPASRELAFFEGCGTSHAGEGMAKMMASDSQNLDSEGWNDTTSSNRQASGSEVGGDLRRSVSQDSCNFDQTARPLTSTPKVLQTSGYYKKCEHRSSTPSSTTSQRSLDINFSPMFSSSTECNSSTVELTRFSSSCDTLHKNCPSFSSKIGKEVRSLIPRVQLSPLPAQTSNSAHSHKHRHQSGPSELNYPTVDVASLSDFRSDRLEVETVQQSQMARPRSSLAGDIRRNRSSPALPSSVSSSSLSSLSPERAIRQKRTAENRNASSLPIRSLSVGATKSHSPTRKGSLSSSGHVSAGDQNRRSLHKPTTQRQQQQQQQPPRNLTTSSRHRPAGATSATQDRNSAGPELKPTALEVKIHSSADNEYLDSTALLLKAQQQREELKRVHQIAMQKSAKMNQGDNASDLHWKSSRQAFSRPLATQTRDNQMAKGTREGGTDERGLAKSQNQMASNTLKIRSKGQRLQASSEMSSSTGQMTKTSATQEEAVNSSSLTSTSDANCPDTSTPPDKQQTAAAGEPDKDVQDVQLVTRRRETGTFTPHNDLCTSQTDSLHHVQNDGEENPLSASAEMEAINCDSGQLHRVSSQDDSDMYQYKCRDFSLHQAQSPPLVHTAADIKTSLFESGYSSDIKSPEMRSPVQEIEEEAGGEVAHGLSFLPHSDIFTDNREKAHGLSVKSEVCLMLTGKKRENLSPTYDSAPSPPLSEVSQLGWREESSYLEPGRSEAASLTQLQAGDGEERKRETVSLGGNNSVKNTLPELSPLRQDKFEMSDKGESEVNRLDITKPSYLQSQRSTDLSCLYEKAQHESLRAALSTCLSPKGDGISHENTVTSDLPTHLHSSDSLLEQDTGHLMLELIEKITAFVDGRIGKNEVDYSSCEAQKSGQLKSDLPDSAVAAVPDAERARCAPTITLQDCQISDRLRPEEKLHESFLPLERETVISSLARANDLSTCKFTSPPIGKIHLHAPPFLARSEHAPSGPQSSSHADYSSALHLLPGSRSTSPPAQHTPVGQHACLGHEEGEFVHISDPGTPLCKSDVSAAEPSPRTQCEILPADMVRVWLPGKDSAGNKPGDPALHSYDVLDIATPQKCAETEVGSTSLTAQMSGTRSRKVHPVSEHAESYSLDNSALTTWQQRGNDITVSVAPDKRDKVDVASGDIERTNESTAQELLPSILGENTQPKCAKYSPGLSPSKNLLPVEIHGAGSSPVNSACPSPRRLSPCQFPERPPKETSPFILEIVCELLSKISTGENRDLVHVKSPGHVAEEANTFNLDSSVSVTPQDKSVAGGKRIINKWRSVIKKSRVVAIRESLQVKLSGEEESKSHLPPPPLSPTPPRKYKWARGEGGIWKKVYLDDNGFAKEDNKGDSEDLSNSREVTFDLENDHHHHHHQDDIFSLDEPAQRSSNEEKQSPEMIIGDKQVKPEVFCCQDLKTKPSVSSLKTHSYISEHDAENTGGSNEADRPPARPRNHPQTQQDESGTSRESLHMAKTEVTRKAGSDTSAPDTRFQSRTKADGDEANRISPENSSSPPESTDIDQEGKSTCEKTATEGKQWAAAKVTKENRAKSLVGMISPPAEDAQWPLSKPFVTAPSEDGGHNEAHTEWMQESLDNSEVSSASTPALSASGLIEEVTGQLIPSPLPLTSTWDQAADSQNAETSAVLVNRPVRKDTEFTSQISSDNSTSQNRNPKRGAEQLVPTDTSLSLQPKPAASLSKNDLASSDAENQASSALTKKDKITGDTSSTKSDTAESETVIAKKSDSEDQKTKKYTWPTVAESLKRFQKSIAVTAPRGHLQRGRDQSLLCSQRKDCAPGRGSTKNENKEKQALEHSSNDVSLTNKLSSDDTEETGKITVQPEDLAHKSSDEVADDDVPGPASGKPKEPQSRTVRPQTLKSKEADDISNIHHVSVTLSKLESRRPGPCSWTPPCAPERSLPPSPIITLAPEALKSIAGALPLKAIDSSLIDQENELDRRSSCGKPQVRESTATPPPPATKPNDSQSDFLAEGPPTMPETLQDLMKVMELDSPPLAPSQLHHHHHEQHQQQQNGLSELEDVSSSPSSREEQDGTWVTSPRSGVRRHAPSAKLISLKVWDTHDGDKALRTTRRLWSQEEKPILAGISEIEEAQAGTDANSTRRHVPEPKDSGQLLSTDEDCTERVRASRSPVRPHSKQKKTPRRSLSLPSGALSYGDVKILYKDGHFVTVDTSLEKSSRSKVGSSENNLEDVSEENESLLEAQQLHSNESLASSAGKTGGDLEDNMRSEILSLLERGISGQQRRLSEDQSSWDAANRRFKLGAPVFLSLPRRKGKGQRPMSVDEVQLWKYYSKSQQSLVSHAEMERRRREDDYGRLREKSALKRNNSFTEAMGSNLMLNEPSQRRDSNKVTESAEVCHNGVDYTHQRQSSDETRNNKSRSRGPGFFQRMLQKRKSSASEKSLSVPAASSSKSHTDLSASSLSLASTSSANHQTSSSGNKRDSKESSSLARKMSFRGIFRRKSSTDLSSKKESASDESSSPPIATFLNSDDIGALPSAPISVQRWKDRNQGEADGLLEPDELDSFSPPYFRSRSPRSPPSNWSSQSSLCRSLSQDDNDRTPTMQHPDAFHRRTRSSSGRARTRNASSVSSGERFSGDSSSEYDFMPSDINSEDTLTPRSVSPCIADLSAEGERTLLASPTGSDNLSLPVYQKLTASPQAGRRRVSRDGASSQTAASYKENTVTTSGHTTVVDRGEIASSNSNDSGIQNDVGVGSSAESIQATVKLRKSKSPSPTTERPKSDTTVRWADLLEQVMEPGGVKYRQNANKLRRQPRPKSDLNAGGDEGLDNESAEDGDDDDDDDDIVGDEYEEETDEGGCPISEFRRSVLVTANSLGNISVSIAGSPATNPSTSESAPSITGSGSSSDVRLLMQSRESLLSLVELRRPVAGRDALSAKLAKFRRLSTPQPITVRAEKPKAKPSYKSNAGSTVLTHAHSMPDNLDRLTRKKNYFSLIGSDGQSINSQHSIGDGEVSSDESEYSVDYHPEKLLNTRSSHLMLATLDQMLGEEHLTYAEALWDHVTMDPEELGFRAGDLIRATDVSDKHWWFGVLDDNEGWFPATFVRLRVNQDVMEEELAFLLAEKEEMLVAEHAGTMMSPPNYLDKHQARANVVNEIISAERDYVKHLRDVVEGYVKQARKRPEMFPVEKVTIIFSNIEEIYGFANQLLAQLEESINHEHRHLSELGQCFLDNAKGFEMYSDYCNNHSAACEELRELYRNKRYRHFFEACRLLQEMIEIPLEGFLLTPVQKICKYHLQLAELLKFTAPEHPDFLQVQGALDAMKKIAMLINERKRKMESVEKLAAWQLLVDDWTGPDILEGSSELIYSGELNKVNHAGWSQERYFFLFDHQLIYCKKDLLKKSSFCYKGRIDMDHCQVHSVADGRDVQYNVTVKNAWKLHDTSNDKWYLLVAKTTVTKQRWIKAFQDERRRVKDDTENNFNIPVHVKQAVISNFKQKTSLNKPKGKGKFARTISASHVISSTNRVDAIATLPRKNRHKVKSDGTLGSKTKKINWFFLNKGKS